MSTNGTGITRHAVENQPEIIHNFRRCFMKGCLGMGNWTPIIGITPDRIQWGHMRLRLMIVCDHHKNTIGLEDLVDGPIQDGRSAWEVIQSAFVHAGKDAPLKEFTTLKWELA